MPPPPPKSAAQQAYANSQGMGAGFGAGAGVNGTPATSGFGLGAGPPMGQYEQQGDGQYKSQATLLYERLTEEQKAEAARQAALEGQTYFGGTQANALANAQGIGSQVSRYSGIQDQGLARQAAARGLQAAAIGHTGAAASMYRNAALGLGPSVAQQQLAQGLAASQAQQASIAAGARGGGANFAAAQLAGAQQMGGLSAVANQQAAQLRAQEQLAAMQGYGAMAGQFGQQANAMGAQDLALAGMGQAGMSDWEKMRQAQYNAELDARMRKQAIDMGAWQTALAESSANKRAQDQRNQGYLAMGIGALGGIAGFAAGGPAGAAAGYGLASGATTNVLPSTTSNPHVADIPSASAYDWATKGDD